MRFQKILVPVDFSEFSDKAVEYALVLGERYGAHLTLLHVVALFQEDVDEESQVQAYEDFVKEREVRIHQQMEVHKNGAVTRGVKIESVILRGISIADTILQYLDESDFDLVVMGTHGRSGLKHLIHGSVAEKVVRLSAQPVLTIHRSATKYDFHKIMVPIDFSPHSKQAADYAISLAKFFKAKLVFFHVIEQEVHPSFYTAGVNSIFEIDRNLRERVIQNMQEFVDDQMEEDMPAEYLVQEGKAYKEIVDLVNEKQIDLIVIATHGLTGLDYLLLGSTTEKVVRWATCPVLTVKRRA